MDFYETSACTNLNIKEVRALDPSPAEREVRRGGQRGAWPLGQLQDCEGRGQQTNACTLVSQSFTRLTELVLQAHRKELDGLRTRASSELPLAELEEDVGKPEGPENSSKTCWC